jgi:hypothetical protein
MLHSVAIVNITVIFFLEKLIGGTYLQILC